jgi:Tol biopolymer transport system component
MASEDLTIHERDPLAPGTLVGVYRIETALGEGGMGKVFRALDTRLNRPVAIKFLSDELADAAARRRFQREAQTASSLNHPHILTVHDVGEFDGRQYIVTEFVDGGTLKHWATAEKRTWRQTVELLTGVADGLAAAHATRITHRDIKPANILVAKNGYAKLADFGLAKLVEHRTQQEETRTLTEARTKPGMILGSIPYMSPEQASGRPVDARSDIFSFGTLLYEALTGGQPFRGATDLQVLQAVMHQEPAPLGTDLPMELRSIVGKALEKEPSDRYQTMRDMVVDLRRASRVKAVTAEPASVSARRWTVSVACVALAAGAVVGRWIFGNPTSGWRNPLEGAAFTRLTDFEGVESDAVISADGNFVAFMSDSAGQRDVWVSQLGSGQFLNLTQGRAVLTPAQMMSFTPDGSQVTFGTVSVNPADGKQVQGTSVVPTIGGPTRLLLDARLWPKWSPDGSRLLFFSLVGDKDIVYTADRAGASPHEVFPAIAGEHNHYVMWSADARYIYTVRATENLQEFDIWQVPAAGGKPERLTHHNAYVAYPAALDDRTLLYIAADENGTGTWLYAMDLKRGEQHRLSVGIEHYTSIAVNANVPGRSRRLVATISNPTGSLWTIPITSSIAPESAATPFAVPSAGVSSARFGPGYLLYLSSRQLADSLWKLKGDSASELWNAAAGAVLAPPAVSADGRQIAVTAMKQGRPGLYLMSSDGANPEQLAPSLRIREEPAWAPDGKALAVVGEGDDGPGLFLVPTDGRAPVRLYDKRCRFPIWSPDGRYIVFAEYFQGPQMHLQAVTVDGKRVSLPEIRMTVTQLPKNLTPYRFMPDGKSLVLQDGGWRSQQFFLINMDTGERRRLTDLKTGQPIRSFDVSPDGKRILFDRVQENSDIVLIDLSEQKK